MRPGLHVIGTERHESRRVDNQLRAGPDARVTGSTRFFLSLGDNLLCIFGGERVAGLMNASGWRRTCRSNPACSPAPWKGRRRRWRRYYDIREQVFEYDEVMNNQRRAVYSERRRVLDGRLRDRLWRAHDE